MKITKQSLIIIFFLALVSSKVFAQKFPDLISSTITVPFFHIQKGKDVETRKGNVEISLEPSGSKLNRVRIQVQGVPELYYTILQETSKKTDGDLVIVEYNALMSGKPPALKLSLFIYNRALKAVSIDNKSSIWIFSSK